MNVKFDGWTVKSTSTQVECRKQFGEGHLLPIVCDPEKGYTHKFRTPDAQYGSTIGYDMQIPSNSPLQLTLDDFDEIRYMIDQARKQLGLT